MPEDKKNQKRNDPKDQRRPRGRRNDAQVTDKKAEKKSDEPKEVPKAPAKPTYQEPGPEFYKNLKRETDEILKITEEESNKYKKKEIQSNWSKYEMPIDSYDEIEEQENMGADYEKLIEAPLAVGGHFQFKHEKTWETNTGPSPYDKYFEINMDTLSLALSTIPFYERNSIDKSFFTETDITNMNNRATRYRQKYFNENKYKNCNDKDTEDNSPQHEIQQKIINNLIKEDDNDDNAAPNTESASDTLKNENPTNSETSMDIIDLESKEEISKETVILNNSKQMEPTSNICPVGVKVKDHSNDSEDDFIFAKIEKPLANLNTEKVLNEIKLSSEITGDVQDKNPVIESPEDLEKWLDDFLDG